MIRVIDPILTETNRFANQELQKQGRKNKKKSFPWKNISKEEIEIFFLLL